MADRPDAAHARLPYLDSLRGVAASAVVVFHCWAAADGPERLGLTGTNHSPTVALLRALSYFLDMGRAAVMLFFVLSGFVLARSLQGSGDTYGGYAVKRILRIYPAFAAVVASSLVLHSLIGTAHAPGNVLMERIDAPDMTVPGVAQAFFLWGTSHSLNLDLVMWSLVHEMRISLLFPLLLWTVQAGRRPAVAAYLAVSMLCTAVLYATTGRVAYGFVETSFVQTLAVTGFFAVFFAAGAHLALERERIAARVRAIPAWGTAALLGLCLLVFLKGDHGAEFGASSLVDYAHGAAAVGVIALALGSARFARALCHPVLCWLGRVSYSLYLVHLPVLYVVMQTFGFGRPLLTAVSVVMISLLAAHCLAAWIEFPCMALGKRLSRRYNQFPISMKGAQ
jgi:peptidoglycan/LPS O-acetylase OafA/YrhL